MSGFPGYDWAPAEMVNPNPPENDTQRYADGDIFEPVAPPTDELRLEVSKNGQTTATKEKVEDLIDMSWKHRMVQIGW